jgi:hypothetical protein
LGKVFAGCSEGEDFCSCGFDVDVSMEIFVPYSTHFVNITLGLELFGEKKPNGLPCDALDFPRQQLEHHSGPSVGFGVGGIGAFDAGNAVVFDSAATKVLRDFQAGS